MEVCSGQALAELLRRQVHPPAAVQHPALSQNHVLLGDQPEEVDLLTHVQGQSQKTKQSQGKSRSKRRSVYFCTMTNEPNISQKCCHSAVVVLLFTYFALLFPFFKTFNFEKHSVRSPEKPGKVIEIYK